MKVHYTVFSHHMSVLCYPESEEVLCDNNNFSIKLLSDTFTIKESLQLDSETAAKYMGLDARKPVFGSVRTTNAQTSLRIRET